MHRTLVRGLALAVSTLAIGWTVFHLELSASYPEADAVLSEAPTELWLQFSVPPDMERTSFSVRGPEGRIALGDMVQGEGDETKTVHAAVSGPMPAGDYMVSWVGAPMDDHTVRGRFSFSLEAQR